MNEIFEAGSYFYKSLSHVTVSHETKWGTCILKTAASPSSILSLPYSWRPEFHFPCPWTWRVHMLLQTSPAAVSWFAWSGHHNKMKQELDENALAQQSSVRISWLFPSLQRWEFGKFRHENWSIEVTRSQCPSCPRVLVMKWMVRVYYMAVFQLWF